MKIPYRLKMKKCFANDDFFEEQLLRTANNDLRTTASHSN